jgi:hypothetical protein
MALRDKNGTLQEQLRITSHHVRIRTPVKAVITNPRVLQQQQYGGPGSSGPSQVTPTSYTISCTTVLCCTLCWQQR